jgi:RNA recognition motif-containing protein
MATKLFVGNLSFNTTEGEILDLFKQAGNVTKCELIIDKFTNKSRGFAFVEMGSQEEANAAISQFNGKELGGRALTVNEARPREDRPRGDFGGGGGRGGGGRGFGGGGGRGGDRGGDRGGRSRY